MLNEIVLSGIIKKVKIIDESILAVIKCNESLFYIYWERNEYDTSQLVGKFVCLRGYLQHIQYKLEENITTTKILAICVEEMEEVSL